jgi:hypothetical protein
VPESTNHTSLLSRLLIYVQQNMNEHQRLFVLHDMPGAIGCEKPPVIGGYRPDLYAADTPITAAIIGEAKTSNDLETDHSKEQYRAYARYLAMYPGSTMILAVPWHLRVRALTLLRLATNEVNAACVSRIVIDDVQEFTRD